MGLLQVSCSDDKDPGPGPEGKGEVYLSFRLNTDPAGVNTRATIDYGTPEERKVSQIYMLLYEGEGGDAAKLILKRKIEANNGDGTMTFQGPDVVTRRNPDENRFVAKAIEVKKKSYQMIVLVNPNSSILSKTTENLHTVADMQEVILNASVNDYMTNGFFMTNAGGVIPVLPAQLKMGDLIAEDEPVTVPVERVLAKILVFENRNKALTEVTTGGTIASVHWGVDVTNKQTYLLRKQDYLKGGADAETGFYSNRRNVYAQDPNFTDNKLLISDDLEKEKHFVSLNTSLSTGFKPWNTFADKGQPATQYQYVFENTVSADDQNATDVDPLSYMTHLILKVVVKNPGKSPNVIADDDYYSYSYMNPQTNKLDWRAFTYKQAIEWYNGTFPSDTPTGMKEAMKEAHDDSDSAFEFEIDPFGVAPLAPTEYTTLTTSYGQLTFHKGGLNIYRIPIMHFGSDSDVTDETDYGYYGIVRNNTYNIIINSINGPGLNTSNEGFISTQITVNPWFERGWGEDLVPER